MDGFYVFHGSVEERGQGATKIGNRFFEKRAKNCVFYGKRMKCVCFCMLRRTGCF